MSTIAPPCHPARPVDSAPILADGHRVELLDHVVPSQRSRVDYIGYVTDYECDDDGLVYVTWLHTDTESCWPRQALRAATRAEMDRLS